MHFVIDSPISNEQIEPNIAQVSKRARVKNTIESAVRVRVEMRARTADYPFQKGVLLALLTERFRSFIVECAS
ncbi:MAG: hypothetical protein C7B45_12365 [Sulfobacillus acidophilus]|uniref:Uncharacterized protein n=1 Tax=Sulfobacillus acidophilus TaxID=53633 RepID=A0A2T2WFK5_9FIRM|nr:MAG: hypothetical protein C7B45_12365 [Sulfobacillus acidophilus]